METWRTPNGQEIEVHYWRNSKTGEYGVITRR